VLDNLKTYLHYGNSFCGIEYTFKNEKENYIVTILKKSKNKLDIEDSFCLESLEDLKNRLKKTQPIFLILNTKNIITKCIDESVLSNLDSLVFRAFPNLNINDFYYEVISQENKMFISICRKDYLDDIILKFKEKNIFIVNISFDNNAASCISNFLGNDNYFSSNSLITLKNNVISDIEKGTEIIDSVYNINGLETSNSNLLSLSGALALVIQNFTNQTNFEELKINLLDNLKHLRRFHLGSRTGLIAILTILLLNFLVFNHYFSAVNELQEISQINQTSKKQFTLLNKRVAKSQKTVEDMLKGNSSKSSFYANQIIQSLPKSILLSELNYQPLIKKIKEDRPIQTSSNTLLISGFATTNTLLSDWINLLENLDWIDSVEILNFEDISKLNSQFSVKINIADD